MLERIWHHADDDGDDEREPEARPCPRCGAQDTLALGTVASSAFWFSCKRCNFVWAIPTSSDDH